MTWTQHVMACDDAAALTGEDAHSDCTAILCEATGEAGWEDGAVVWVSHARREDAAAAEGVEPGPAAAERINPGITAEDWR